MLTLVSCYFFISFKFYSLHTGTQKSIMHNRSPLEAQAKQNHRCMKLHIKKQQDRQNNAFIHQPFSISPLWISFSILSLKKNPFLFLLPLHLCVLWKRKCKNLLHTRPILLYNSNCYPFTQLFDVIFVCMRCISCLFPKCTWSLTYCCPALVYIILGHNLWVHTEMIERSHLFNVPQLAH